MIFHTGLGSEDKYLEFPAEGTESDLHAQELIATLEHLYNRDSYKNVRFLILNQFVYVVENISI